MNIIHYNKIRGLSILLFFQFETILLSNQVSKALNNIPKCKIVYEFQKQFDARRYLIRFIIL